MTTLTIALILAAALFVIAVLVAVFSDKWLDSIIPFDIEDRLADADEDVAHRARLGGL